MSRKKRAQNLREAKDRRMKKVAIGGAVLLVAVLAYEMSHMLGGKKTTAPPSSTSTTTASTGAPATTSPAGTPAATPLGTAAATVLPTTASTKLPNSDAAPSRSKSQLYAFSNFAGKDPFVQQMSTGAQLSTPATGSSSSASSPPTGITQTAKVSGGTARQNRSAARTLAKVGAATISINGRRETVRLGAGFPSSNPVFRLVSVSHGTVRIGIANGSYTSGARTVSLVAGRTLTLVDTADGIHYKLQLLAGA